MATSVYPPTTVPASRATATTGLLLMQGAYYLATGLWPLISVESFQWVTGEKTDHLVAAQPTEADHWMVMTIGVLVAAIGLGLLIAGVRRKVSAEIVVIAVAAAVG